MSDTLEQPPIAVLIDRMNTMKDGIAEIKNILIEQNRVLQEVPILKVKLDQHDEQIERAFKAISDNRRTTETNTNAITHSKGALKIVTAITGFIATAALTLAGWAYNQLDTLKATDSALMLRISSLEVRSTAEAEKINQRGWVRK